MLLAAVSLVTPDWEHLAMSPAAVPMLTGPATSHVTSITVLSIRLAVVQAYAVTV